jgi:nucleoside-diphosphate-sugar epimerase
MMVTETKYGTSYMKSDIVKTITLALEHEVLKGKIINVCTGAPTSVNHSVATMKTVTEENFDIKH